MKISNSEAGAGIELHCEVDVLNTGPSGRLLVFFFQSKSSNVQGALDGQSETH